MTSTLVAIDSLEASISASSNAFKKIRITGKPNKTIEDLFNKRRILRTRSDDKSREELIKVEELLANLSKMMKDICGS